MANKKPIEAGLITRLTTGVKYILTGKKPDWFGPGDPLPPEAQEAAIGRQFDFPVLSNVTRGPRDGENISFASMRSLAESCDILRLVIETRKDQIEKMTWGIKPRDQDQQPDDRCKQVYDFLQLPDREHTWSTWLRMLLEDLFVLDAPTIYVRPTLGGDPFSFELIDGSTIKRIIDQTGRTPAAPAPAYQQILKGLPAVNYSSDEMIYMPRNPRTHKVYGYSPVEQIVFTVNIALRRSLHQLQYYTEGNIPEAIIGVPESWNPDQIKQFQTYWDSLLEGNTAAKRHAKFIPGGLKLQETKSGVTQDKFDEWLARIVCFCFSISPQPFLNQMNRATAETAQAAAISEGLTPIMQWIENLVNLIIAKFFGYPDLCFGWEVEEALQPDIQAKILDTKVKNATLTVNEARALDGLDPVEDGDELLIYTAQGAVRLKDIVNPPPPPDPPPPPPLIPDAETASEPTSTPTAATPSKGEGSDVSPDGKEKEALGKGKKQVAHIDRDRKSIVGERNKLQATIAKFFRVQAKAVASQVIDLIDKISVSDAIRLAQILKDIDLNGWDELGSDVQEILEIIGKDGGEAALAQVGIEGAPEEVTNLINDGAIEYAKTRSAELVGMKWVDGELVENPNAEWAITDSTREFLRADIQQALEDGIRGNELADMLEDNYAFSDSRAEMIARTETAFADVNGNLNAYKASGVVQGKTWIAAPSCCEFCQELDGMTVGIDEDFPNDGGDGPPLHPNCICDILPETDYEPADEDEENTAQQESEE